MILLIFLNGGWFPRRPLPASLVLRHPEDKRHHDQQQDPGDDPENMSLGDAWRHAFLEAGLVMPLPRPVMPAPMLSHT
jgi:hypothetical protein